MMATATATKKRRSDLSRCRRILRPRQQLRCLADLEDDGLELKPVDKETNNNSSSKEMSKLKLVLKLPPVARSSSQVTVSKSRRHVARPDWSEETTSSSDTSASEDEEEDEVIPLKKRRIERGRDLGGSGHREESKKNVVRRPIRAASGTPMPKMSSLEVIIDKLQIKDTYRVFAQPVNPEELPDYHDVIEHPMDFDTIRKKLARGRYQTFEQFEDDIFLICSNAMQYNAPDTIYFNQAHSIQDMARTKFQELRADLNSKGAERKFEENVRPAYNSKNTEKSHKFANAPKLSSFENSSSQRKTMKQHECRSALKPLGHALNSTQKNTQKAKFKPKREQSDFGFSSMEKESSKRPDYRTYKTALDPLDSEASLFERPARKPESRFDTSTTEPQSSYHSEKKTLRKPQYRIATAPRSSDAKKTQYRTDPKSPDGNISFMENKTSKKELQKTERLDSDTSYVEKKAVNIPQYKTERLVSNKIFRPEEISSIGKTSLRKPQSKNEPESFGSHTSSQEKKPQEEQQSRTEPGSFGSDTSSQEKKSQEDHQSRTEPGSFGSDISSQEKKPQEEHQSRTERESLGSDFSSGATLTSADDTLTGLSKIQADGTVSCTGLSTIKDTDTCANLNKAEKSVSLNVSADACSSLDERMSEKEDETPAKSLPSKHTQNPFVVDINRRATYNKLEEEPAVGTDSVYNIFEGERRQLITVGPNSEYSYARSLARFAASLGSIGWEIVSKKIKQTLPPEVKFGPGWVGEYEPLSTPILSFQNNSELQLGIQREGKRNEVKSEAINIGRRERNHENTTGVNLEMPPCPSRTTLQQIKINQSSHNLAKACANITTGNMHNISFGTEKSNCQAVISNGWNLVHNGIQKQNQQQKKIEQGANVGKSVSPAIFSQGWSQVQNEVPKKQHQQKSNQMIKVKPEPQTDDFTNTCTNQQNRFSFQTQTSKLSEINFTRSRPHYNLVRNHELVAAQRQHPAPFGTISNQNTGAQFWVTRGNQQHAINDPLKWLSSSGKILNNSNTIKQCSNNLNRTVPNIQIPKSEDPLMPIGFNQKTQSPTSWVQEGGSIKQEIIRGAMENSKAQNKRLFIFPDLNLNFQPPVSPTISSLDPQQPDLALQL